MWISGELYTSAKNHLLITKKVASAKSSSIIFLQFLYGFLHYFRVITWFYLSVQIQLELFYSILSAKEFNRNNYTCFFCLLNYACYYDHDPLNLYSGFLPKLLCGSTLNQFHIILHHANEVLWLIQLMTANHCQRHGNLVLLWYHLNKQKHICGGQITEQNQIKKMWMKFRILTKTRWQCKAELFCIRKLMCVCSWLNGFLSMLGIPPWVVCCVRSDMREFTSQGTPVIDAYASEGGDYRLRILQLLYFSTCLNSFWQDFEEVCAK